MREFLENNPALALLGACAACIVATFGVLTYFHERDLSNTSATFEREIGELEEQISSIERGIPIDGERSFNVASSVVAESKMLLLSSEFEVLVPSLISVDPPTLDAWKYEKLNEISIKALNFDDACKERLLGKIKGKLLPSHIKPVFVWHRRASNSAYIKIPDQSPSKSNQKSFLECDYIRIFPSLSVYQIDSDWIKNNVKFFSLHLTPENLSKKNLESFIADPASMISDPDVEITYMNEDSKFLSEFTGPFLFSKMYQMLMLATIFPETAPRVMSIEKAINTLYFHNRYRFFASIDEDSLSKKDSVVLDDEYFVISVGDSAVVVNITLPILKDHHENFVWTQGWLSGLRVQSPPL